MAQRRFALTADHISNSTFLARVPIGLPEMSERMAESFVLCRSPEGDIYYYEAKGLDDWPQNAQRFETAEEALRWLNDEALRWVRRELGGSE